MARLLITLDGAPVGERDIDKERITIGRRAHNDIVLDNIGVSGEHAVLVTILNDSYIEDLESTNGTEVNGTATRKHFLRNGDQIAIGNHRLQYVGVVAAMREAADFEKTMVLNRPTGPAREPALGDVRSATVASGWAGAEAAGEDVAVLTRPPLAVMVERPVMLAPGGSMAAPAPAAFTVPASADAFPALPSDALADIDALATSAALAAGQTVAEPIAPARRPVSTESAPSETRLAETVATQAAAAPQATDLAAPIGSLAPAAGAPSASAGPGPAVNAAPSGARLQVLNGSAAGRILEICKPLTTVGRPGIQVVVVSRRSDGFYLAQVDGESAARLNGAALVPHAVALHAHDVLEVAGVKLEFFYQA